MSGFRRFLQIVWSIASILALLVAIFVIFPVRQITPFIVENILAYESARIVIVALLALMVLFFIITLFHGIFAKSSQSRLEVEGEEGTLAIESKTIEAIVLRSIEDHPMIEDADVDVKLYNNPEDTKVKVDCIITEPADVTQIAQDVQLKAKTAVNQMLGVRVNDVDVEVKKVEKDEYKQSDRAKRAPRVR